LILVTVGSQKPFDRLIRAVDQWAGLRARSDVIAQVANSKYCTQYIRFTPFVDGSEFTRWIERATVIVAHAGTGSIISALEFGKPIVVMPRRSKFNEAHNDHQSAIARYFGAQGRILVAHDEKELARQLDHAVTLSGFARIGTQASPQLLSTIRAFLGFPIPTQNRMMANYSDQNSRALK
jgi:UDP-N-acetylglucosamine transferase subunit ALG13